MTDQNHIDTARLETFQTMAGKIRYLSSLGMTRYQIAKYLDIKYQWVRNVLIQQVKTPKERV